MALKLITETVNNVRALVETVESGPAVNYFIEGIFMQGNKKNQNGRVYPTETLVREMQRYQKEYIERKRAFGELGHPDSPTVNLDRVSHMITKLQQSGDDFVGKAKVMVHTPMGNIVKALIDEGAELGVSSRGLGSLRDTDHGIMEVQDDFYFSTVDIVADPSAPDAVVHGIMEGKAWVWESGALKECALEQMSQKIEQVHIPTVSAEERSAALKESFQQFLIALRRGVKSNIR
jgi:hypothetical protein